MTFLKKFLSIVLTLFLSVTVIFVGSKIVYPKFINIAANIYNSKASNITNEEQALFNAQYKKGTRYYYDLLNEDEKKAYVAIYNMFINFQESRLIKGDAKTLEKISISVLYDNPNIFWVDSHYKYIQRNGYCEYAPNYIFSRDETQDISKRLKDKVSQIKNKADSLSSDYDKELYFHDYLCDSCTYDVSTVDGYKNGVCGALLYGNTACQGYSFAMKMLLDEAGIHNYVVVGETVNADKREPHMWNVVRLNDKNYYVDVTGDDGEDNDNVHIFFNVTEDFISKTHSNIAPQNNNCVSNDYNYFIKNKTYVKDFKTFNQLSDCAGEILKANNSVEFMFESKSDYNKAIKSLNNNNDSLFSFVRSAVKKSGKNLSKTDINIISNDDYNFIKIIFKEG